MNEEIIDPFAVEPIKAKPTGEGDIIDPFAVGNAALVGDSWARDRETYLTSALSGKSLQETKSMVETNTTTGLYSNITAVNTLTTEGLVNESLAQSGALNLSPAEAITELEDIVNNDPLLSKFKDKNTFDILRTSSNPVARHLAAGKLSKTFIAAEMIRERTAASSDKSLTDKIDQWTEMAAQSIIPGVSLVQTNRRIALAKEFSNLLIGDVSDEVFEVEMGRILDSAADQGWFTDDNMFFMQEFLDLMPDGGYGAEAFGQRAWGVADIALFATPVQWTSGARSVGRAALAGTRLTPAMAAAGARLGMDAAVDVSRLIGLARRDPKIAEDIISHATKFDDPNGAVDIARLTNESAATPNAKYGEFNSITQAARAFEVESRLLAKLQEVDIPLPYTDEEFAVVRDQILSQIGNSHAGNGTSRSLDFNVVHDRLGNIYAQEVFGTTRGATFKGDIGKVSAQRLADAIGGEVRPALGSPNEWVVLKSENVALLPNKPTNVTDIALFKATDTGELGNGFWARHGSVLAQTTPELNGLLKRVEASHANLARTLSTEQRKILRSMPKKEIRQVQDVFTSINQGDLAQLNYAPGVQDFNTEFFSLHRASPNKSQVALYLKYQETSDVEYLVTATNMFQQAVSRGEIAVIRNDDSIIRAIKGTKEHAPSDGNVLDINTGTYVKSDTLPADTVFYRSAEGAVEGPGGTNASVFVMSQPKTRRIYPEDLLEYNPGGHRFYRDGEINFYIKQDNSIKMHDGSEVNATPNTVMGVRTETEARAAVKEINDIVTTIKAEFPGVGRYTIHDVLAAAPNNPRVLAAIARSNKWNTNINTVEELITESKAMGLDLTKLVASVGDGEPILEAGKIFPGLNASTTAGATMRINSARSGKRRDTVLLGYGGTANRTRPALESIERGYMSSATQSSEAAYVARATIGIIKEASKEGVLNPTVDLTNLSMKQRLAKMEILQSTEAGRKLELERQKIIWRMAKQNPVDNRWKSGMASLSDHLYGKDMKWGADAVNIMSGNPLTALRGFVFDSQLGFFAIDQLVVQASQITSVVGISGVHGIKGVASYPLARFALMNGDPAVVRRVGELMEPILGLTPDQYVEMISMFKQSGRNIIDMSTAEQGGSEAKGFGKGIREAGRVFFNEGEKVARIAAHNASYMEYLAKFGPDAVPSSASGKNWIANRQDILTQGMTNASRTSYDWIPGAQFLSYTMRMAEAVFAGTLPGAKAVLTKPEKMRLAAVHVFMYGAAGIPTANWALDKIERIYGMRPSDETYSAIRGGLLDATLSHFSGVDTSMSNRLAWGQGFFQLAHDLPEKAWWEILGGPSADITIGGISSAINLAKHMSVGAPDLAKQDLTKIMRSYKMPNLLHNAYLAYTTGEFLSRNGVPLSKDNGGMEAWLVGWGIPLEKHVEAYAKLGTIIKDAELVKSIAKNVEFNVNIYAHLLRTGDLEGANDVMRQIGLVMQSLPSWQRADVWRKVYPAIVPLVEKVALEDLQNRIKRGLN